ncbi:MAG: sulfotransferase domain-containing protein [Pseudomonadota bacterium]
MSAPPTDARRIVWIASYPKSGNTWLRSFLATYFFPPGQAPDINHLRQFTTGDVRIDFYERASGRSPFQATGLEDWVQVRQKALRLIALSKPGSHFVKTHCRIDRVGRLPLIPPALTAGAIYVIRNPFDVAQSYARHLGTDPDGAIEAMADRQATMMTRAKMFEVHGRWDDHIASWTGAEGLHHHVIRYEDMIGATEATFRRLLAFLQQKVDPAALARAIEATAFEKMKDQEREKGFIERPDHMPAFFARGQAGSWRDELTPPQVARIRAEFLPAIERWYPEMLDETAAIAGQAS